MGLLFSSEPLQQADLAGRNCGVHNMSFGCLQAYFRLTSVPREQILWDGEVLSVSGLPGGNTKTWVFKSDTRLPLSEYQRRGPVYAIDRLELPKEGKFTEIKYDLREVFNPESYSPSKKRHQRIRYPFSWLRTNEVTLRNLTTDDLPEIERINASWCEWKLAQPTTYQIMFPRRRNLTCAEYALDHRYASNYLCLGAEQRGKLVAVRVVYIEDGQGYDLANFGLYHEMAAQFSEYIVTATMREMLDKGIESLNCGAVLNKGLSSYKHHWPSRPVLSWSYGRIQ